MTASGAGDPTPLHIGGITLLRGRKTVRVDRRSRTDDEAIRAQSAILDKTNPMLFLILFITVFSARMLFIRAENTVGARSAQVCAWDAAEFKMPNAEPVAK